MEGILIALGALGGGAIAAIATAWANRDKTGAETEKTDAEAAQIISNTATALLDKAMEQSHSTEARLLVEIKALEVKVDTMSAVIESLIDQMKKHGIEPVLPAIWHGQKQNPPETGGPHII